MTIRVNVGRQMDGRTYELDYESRDEIVSRFPESRPVSRIFVSYETQNDFERLHGALLKHVAALLTGLPEEALKEVDDLHFVDPQSGEEFSEPLHHGGLIGVMSQQASLYIGQAGQAAVMSEFLCRGGTWRLPKWMSETICSWFATRKGRSHASR